MGSYKKLAELVDAQMALLSMIMTERRVSEGSMPSSTELVASDCRSIKVNMAFHLLCSAPLHNSSPQSMYH